MQNGMSDTETGIVFTILGSGTSSGIPTIGCKCSTCTSIDPRDKRLRCSLLAQSNTTTIVIDTSSDFRQQMLYYGVDKLDAVLFTHHHFDHIGGFDDIRAFNYHTRKPLNIYLNKRTRKELKRTFIYAFEEPEQRGGGVPQLNEHIIENGEFVIGDIKITSLRLLHGKLEVLGFRIGDFAYCTDTNYIPPESMKQLSGLKTIVLDALRYDKHSTHFNVEQAVECAKLIDAETTYLTHIAHQIKHDECEEKLPENIKLAYDGLKINSVIN